MDRVKALETALKEAKEGAMKDRKKWVYQYYDSISVFIVSYDIY